MMNPVLAPDASAHSATGQREFPTRSVAAKRNLMELHDSNS